MTKPNARIARLKAEREAKEAAILASHLARLARRKEREQYLKDAKAGLLPPATPLNDIPDIGGDDNLGNPL